MGSVYWGLLNFYLSPLQISPNGQCFKLHAPLNQSEYCGQRTGNRFFTNGRLLRRQEWVQVFRARSFRRTMNAGFRHWRIKRATMYKTCTASDSTSRFESAGKGKKREICCNCRFRSKKYSSSNLLFLGIIFLIMRSQSVLESVINWVISWDKYFLSAFTTTGTLCTNS